jgi:hypothetical protein
LRNILGTKTLQEILQDKENIAHHMQELLDHATDEWYLFHKMKKYIIDIKYIILF